MAFLLDYFEVVSLKNHLAAGTSFRKSEPRQKTKCPVERLRKRQSDQIEELEHTQANISADTNDNPLITRVASLCSLLHPSLSHVKRYCNSSNYVNRRLPNLGALLNCNDFSCSNNKYLLASN